MPRKPKNCTAESQSIVKSRIGNEMSASRQKIIEEVFNSMECPVCMEFLQAPIYMCGTGHNICQKCRKKLTTPACPVCKAMISDQRNYSLEDISFKLSLPCQYSKFGCNVVNLPIGVDSHTKVCKFKPFKCPIGREFGKCSHLNITIFNMEDHFQKQHPGNTLLKAGEEVILPNFNISVDCCDMHLVVFDDSLFLYHVNVDTNESVAYWTVQWVANKSQHRIWKYEFHFSSEKHESEIVFSGKCHTMHVDSKEIFDSGNCVAIPLGVLKNFVHEKNLQFKFFLKPLNMNKGKQKA